MRATKTITASGARAVSSLDGKRDARTKPLSVLHFSHRLGGVVLIDIHVLNDNRTVVPLDDVTESIGMELTCEFRSGRVHFIDHRGREDVGVELQTLTTLVRCFAEEHDRDGARDAAHAVCSAIIRHGRFDRAIFDRKERA